jgi:hypothetical protein
VWVREAEGWMPSLLIAAAAAAVERERGVSCPDDTTDCSRWGTLALKASRAAASACRIWNGSGKDELW